MEPTLAGGGSAVTPGMLPLIVTVAPNGARRTKTDHRALPISDKELAETAEACLAAGAAMIHVHVRDSNGNHSLDPQLYRSATDAIRRVVGQDLIVQITSESVGVFHRDEQMAMIRTLRPEAVSLAIGEIIPDPSSESSAAEFFAWLKNEHIMPQYILYSAEEVRYFHQLRERGVVPGEQPFVLFVLGRYSPTCESEPLDLLPFLSAHDAKCPWAVCAFGSLEATCTIAAISFLGHTRVGFENNLLLSDGTLAPDNAALVAQNAAAAPMLGRSVANADIARRLLGFV